MPHIESDPQLRLITWNVNRSKIDNLRKQLAAVQERTPDIVALQEVGIKASRKPRKLMRENGFEYAAHSHEFRPDDPGRSSGIAFASRWPFRVLPPETFDMPAQHQALSAEFFTPFGRIEGHSVHILPGSQVGETKVEMFEGIHDRLAREDPPEYRFLCGDFNSPKAEGPEGEVAVWGGDDRWMEAERSVMVGLAEYNLTDAYRAVNGYGDDAYSFVTKRKDDEWRRRFDHVFASHPLNAVEAEYLHQYDNLSDHSPLEVVFTPEGGLRDPGVSTIERESFSPAGSPSQTGDNTVSARVDGLSYDEDNRAVDPEEGYRLGRFKAGWTKAVNGREMAGALDRLTWENLGWRLGRLFGETSTELQKELYEWCVAQQTNGNGERADEE